MLSKNHAIIQAQVKTFKGTTNGGGCTVVDVLPPTQLSRTGAPIHQASNKQIAQALAKAYGLPYEGRTSGGKKPHAPSIGQIKHWIEANS